MRYDLVIFDFDGTLVDGALRLIPDAAEVLRDLAEAGFTLGIVGSVDDQAAREALGPAQYLFDAYACQTTGLGTSQKLEWIVRHMEAQFEGTLYVGDETSDIDAARSAGVASAAVTWGNGKRARLAAAGPTMLAESFDELARYLTNQPHLRLVSWTHP